MRKWDAGVGRRGVACPRLPWGEAKARTSRAPTVRPDDAHGIASDPVEIDLADEP
jgi:hypothetical protein